MQRVRIIIRNYSYRFVICTLFYETSENKISRARREVLWQTHETHV
jgi:hypothetical protein